MNQEKQVHEYTRGNLTIVWKPGLCIHSGVCVKALPEVYRPKEKPWIRPELASEEALKSQIARCPSGALSFHEAGANPAAEPDLAAIQVVPGGPFILKGKFQFEHEGRLQTLEGRNTLCRCGGSSKKPFCDGTHRKLDFDKPNS